MKFLFNSKSQFAFWGIIFFWVSISSYVWLFFDSSIDNQEIRLSIMLTFMAVISILIAKINPALMLFDFYGGLLKTIFGYSLCLFLCLFTGSFLLLKFI